MKNMLLRLVLRIHRRMMYLAGRPEWKAGDRMRHGSIVVDPETYQLIKWNAFSRTFESVE